MAPDDPGEDTSVELPTEDDGWVGGDRLLDIAGVLIFGFLLVGLAVGTFTFVSGPADDAADAPDAEWTLERVNDSHVRITHAGGDNVPTSALVVTADGVQRRVAWNGVLSEGESGVVRAQSGVVVRLYWITETGDRVRLASWDD